MIPFVFVTVELFVGGRNPRELVPLTINYITGIPE